MRGPSRRFAGFWIGLISLAILTGCAVPFLQYKKPVPVEQQKAFDTAMLSFYDREFGRAAAGFQTLAGRYPDSPLIEETSWMLARSIEEGSDFGDALRAYKIFSKKFPLSRHRSEADFRIQHLKSFIAQRPAPDEFPRRVGRVLSNPRGISGRLAELLPSLTLKGEKVLVIPAAREEGAYFESRGIPVVDPVLPGLVSEAQSLGWKVWASVQIRRVPGLSVPGKGGAPQGMDLFDPSVHEKLTGFLGDLAETGVDGIVINDDPLYDPREGFSSNMIRAFQKDYGVSSVQTGTFSSGVPFTKTGNPSDDPLLWQMIGWRNRETMDRIEKLIIEVREEFPFLVWAQRVSREAVTEPHTTLVRSGENLVQSLQSGVDFFIVPFSFRVRDPDPYAFLRKVEEVMAEPRRMILALPMDEREWVGRFEKDLPGVGFFFGAQAAEPSQP